jgi:hypothetical protein
LRFESDSEGHRTFSLLPVFPAVGLSSLLAAIDDSITVAASARSMEAAADGLRRPEVTLARTHEMPGFDR